MYLAQLNIGRILAPIDSPIMAEFKNNLDKINKLAEESDGFIWRLKDDSNNATSIKLYDDDLMIPNMSVWRDKDSLFKYVYRTEHVEFFKRRKEWFEKMTDRHMVLWNVPIGHNPTLAEAIERLEHLRAHGESDYAFTFSKR